MPYLLASGDPLHGSAEVTATIAGADQLSITLVRNGSSLDWTRTSPGGRDRTDGSAPETGPDPVLDAGVVCALLRGGAGGPPSGQVRVRPGPAHVPGAPLTVSRSRPLPTDGSSNHVSLVTVDGIDYVHKRYRGCHVGAPREADALRALSGSRTAPELLAEYSYHDSDGRRWPLGLLYRYVPGVGLDVPLRADLRAVLATQDPRPTAPGRSVGRILRATGALAWSVHEVLASTSENPGGARRRRSTPDLDVAGVLVRAGADLETVLQRVAALPEWAAPVVPAARAGLRAELVAIHATAVGQVAAGPCHGDLHLGQVVVGDVDDPGSVRVIDLSPLSLHAGEPDHCRQTPWQDLVSLERALEYFTTQEAHRQVAVVTGLDEAEVSRSAAIGVPLSGHATAQLRRSERRAAAWRAAALAVLLSGYGPSAVSTADPLYRLLYLVRLLHELRYDLDHGRYGFVVQNLRRASELGAGAAAPRPVLAPGGALR